MSKKAPWLLLTNLMIVILLSACGNSKMYAQHQNGYKQITAVSGVQFDVPQTAIEISTAITGISNDMRFEEGETYLYKNGTSEYLLFSMQSIVIAVEKNTTFAFSASEDQETSLTGNDILGIWFEKEARTFSPLESNAPYKLMSPVKAQVVITDELFKDFVGMLTTIQDEESQTEYSLFIGSIADSYKELPKAVKKQIEHVSKSFCLSQEVSVEETNEVMVGGEHKELPSAPVQNPKAETEVVREEPSSAQKEKTTSTILVSNQKKNSQKESNSKKTEAVSSSIYEMLSLGESGLIKTRSYTSKEVETPTICIERLIKGKEVVSIIQELAAKQAVPYSYFEAPEGSVWHMVEYSLDVSNCKEQVPVDIKLVGLDGEKLRFRGISYSKRTYVLASTSNPNGSSVATLYCYYAVPNGCKEYALECGDGGADFENEELHPAYYYIKNE